MKQTPNGPSPDSDFNGRSANIDDPPHELAPSYLSGNSDEPDPSEFTSQLRKRGRSVSSRILASVLAVLVIASVFALFSPGNMRKIVADAKALIVFTRPAKSTPSQSDVFGLTAEEIELLRNPARLSNPVVATPPREEIPSTDQSVAQSQVPTTAAPEAAATKELSDSEKEALFKEFLAWEAERKARSQIRPKKAKSPAPTVVKRSPSAGPRSTR